MLLHAMVSPPSIATTRRLATASAQRAPTSGPIPQLRPAMSAADVLQKVSVARGPSTQLPTISRVTHRDTSRLPSSRAISASRPLIVGTVPSLILFMMPRTLRAARESPTCVMPSLGRRRPKADGSPRRAPPAPGTRRT